MRSGARVPRSIKVVLFFGIEWIDVKLIDCRDTELADEIEIPRRLDWLAIVGAGDVCMLAANSSEHQS